MTEDDIQFLMEAIVCVTNNNQKNWLCKEDSLHKLIDLASKYGGEVIHEKIQQIKGIYD
jgi:hypothetical protein